MGGEEDVLEGNTKKDLVVPEPPAKPGKKK
jgi:hypothetical protein